MIKCEIMDICEINDFTGCCESCPDKEGCGTVCTEKSSTCNNAIFEENTAIIPFEEKAAALMNAIKLNLIQKAAFEENEKTMRKQLEEVMAAYGIKKVDYEGLRITYIEPTTRTSVDSGKLKDTYPHIYDECSKTSNVKGHVKIELKKG